MQTGFSIPLERSATPEQIDARCFIPPESSWFSGHFPSNPIFPALGLMGLVDEALGEHGLPHLPSGARRVYKRVRFRQIVRPGDTLSVKLSLPLEGESQPFRFKIFKETDSISEGMFFPHGPDPDRSPAPSEPCRLMERADAPIEELVPHRDRMRLVDDFEGHETTGDGITRSVVRKTWPLCDGEQVNPHVMIELVAQATAAMVGWEDFKKKKQKGFGYIVGIKNAWLAADPVPVGARLTIRTKKIVTQGNYGVFSGKVIRDDRDEAEVLLQVFRAGDLIA
jgi:predicted hotdog family 3-hydroxylacyl-ACP dehydratase